MKKNEGGLCKRERTITETMKTIHYDAAGGVVVQNNHILVLRRPSRKEIRLPKGHIEPGESRQETAQREVAEESGYVDLEIVDDLGHQIVEFDYRDKHVVRNESYFVMRLKSPRQIERTTHERQFVPDWVSWDVALSQLTFEAEREWVRRARPYLRHCRT
jgi:8-oxo-dGTP pyrophosphatase MutT (NUDIX family)